MRRVIACVVVLFGLGGCVAKLPPGGEVVALLPDSAAGALVVHRQLLPEEPTTPREGLASILVSDMLSAFGLDAGENKPWTSHASCALSVEDGEINTRRGPSHYMAKMRPVLVVRSNGSTIPDLEDVEQADNSRIRRVGEIEGVSIVRMRIDSSFVGSGEPAELEAFAAVVEGRTLIAALERTQVEAAVRRVKSPPSAIPLRLRAIGARIPDDAYAYMMRAREKPKSDPRPLRFIMMTEATEMRGDAFATALRPSNDIGFVFIPDDADEAKDIAAVTELFRPRLEGDDLLDRFGNPKLETIRTGPASSLQVRWELKQNPSPEAMGFLMITLITQHANFLQATLPNRGEHMPE